MVIFSVTPSGDQPRTDSSGSTTFWALLVLLKVCVDLTSMRLIPHQTEEISISKKSFQGPGIKQKLITV
jgi:hypothetical protein